MQEEKALLELYMHASGWCLRETSLMQPSNAIARSRLFKLSSWRWLLFARSLSARFASLTMLGNVGNRCVKLRLDWRFQPSSAARFLEAPLKAGDARLNNPGFATVPR
jgi:hypothetical protein